MDSSTSPKLWEHWGTTSLPLKDNRPQLQGFLSASKTHEGRCACAGRDGKRTVFLAGLGVACLCMTVLGCDCITTNYTYTQGIRGSLLSICTALSALSGLPSTMLFSRVRGTVAWPAQKSYPAGPRRLSDTVFATRSPLDLTVFSHWLSQNSSPKLELLKEDEVQVYFFERNMNPPLLLDCSSIHWINSTFLFEGEWDPEHPESYISIILLLSGAILARIDEWGSCVTWDSADCDYDK